MKKYSSLSFMISAGLIGNLFTEPPVASVKEGWHSPDRDRWNSLCVCCVYLTHLFPVHFSHTDSKVVLDLNSKTTSQFVCTVLLVIGRGLVTSSFVSTDTWTGASTFFRQWYYRFSECSDTIGLVNDVDIVFCSWTTSYLRKVFPKLRVCAGSSSRSLVSIEKEFLLLIYYIEKGHFFVRYFISCLVLSIPLIELVVHVNHYMIINMKSEKCFSDEVRGIVFSNIFLRTMVWHARHC